MIVLTTLDLILHQGVVWGISHRDRIDSETITSLFITLVNTPS